ncbi:unnamed protein product [Prunus armeniaca]
MIVSWNVRGAGKDKCASTIKDLKKIYAVDIFAVLEPRISGPRALNVAKDSLVVALCAFNLPWLVHGDFNDIMCAKEKCGGNLDNSGQRFIEWIDRNHLVDLGFSGANFTWCNKRNSEGVIWKRLDRGLCNIEWRLLFPEAHLSHLPRVSSYVVKPS